MTTIAQRLAGIAASLPPMQYHIAAELSEMSVQVARLERAYPRPADILPLALRFARTDIRERGDDPKGAA